MLVKDARLIEAFIKLPPPLVKSAFLSPAEREKVIQVRTQDAASGGAKPTKMITDNPVGELNRIRGYMNTAASGKSVDPSVFNKAMGQYQAMNQQYSNGGTNSSWWQPLVPYMKWM